MKKNTLLCIPAFNEEECIGNVLDSILSSPMSDFFDVLVVNDGSIDRTERICRDKGVMVISHIFNLGYGSSLKTAYKYASERHYEYIIQMDADGQHDVCNIERIYNQLTSLDGPPPDIVIGSRFLEQDVPYRHPLHKRIVIVIINMMVKAMTKRKITDPTSGLQGLSRRAFSFYSGFNNFSFDYPDANMVIQMIMNDFTVKEIPAVMHPRTTGVSMHFGFYKPMKYVVKMLLSIVTVFLRESLNAKKRRAFVKPSAVPAEEMPNTDKTPVSARSRRE